MKNIFNYRCLPENRSSHILLRAMLIFSIVSLVNPFEPAKAAEDFANVNYNQDYKNLSSIKRLREVTEVKGTITDKNGKALSNVLIKERHGTAETISNSNGDYQIKVNVDGKLVFSFPGYKDKKIRVSGKTNLHVVLEEVQICTKTDEDLKRMLSTGASKAIKVTDVQTSGITDISRIL